MTTCNLDIKKDSKELINKIISETYFKNSYEEIENVILFDEDCEYYFYIFDRRIEVERIVDRMSLYSLTGYLKDVRLYINNPNWKDTYKIKKEYDYDDFEFVIVDTSPETDEEYIKRITNVLIEVDNYILNKRNLIKEKKELLKRIKEIDNIINN